MNCMRKYDQVWSSVIRWICNGNCQLGYCRPESCKKYPYTDQSDRWASLYSVLDVIEVCPVAFEIYERLKKEYGWRYRR